MEGQPVRHPAWWMRQVTARPAFRAAQFIFPTLWDCARGNTRLEGASLGQAREVLLWASAVRSGMGATRQKGYKHGKKESKAP